MLKLWTPGVGWATIGGQIFTQKCIDKKFSGIPFSQKSWNLCESFKLWFPAEVCTTRHKYIETTKGAWYFTLKYVNKSQKIYFLILSKIYTVLNCQDIWIWYYNADFIRVLAIVADQVRVVLLNLLTHCKICNQQKLYSVLFTLKFCLFAKKNELRNLKKDYIFCPFLQIVLCEKKTPR